MRRAIYFGTAAVVALVFVFVPPVKQWASYHRLADTRTILGIPNFWNVVTKLPFLAVALWGLRAFRSKAAFTEPWERAAYAVVLAGGALTAAGSSWYHWNPTDETLVWDRLPMTLLFTAVFAMVAGDRLGLDLGRRALIPLLAAGIASIVVWQTTGDLRLYGVVQYLPVLAIPLMLLFLPARYSEARWLWGMCGLYGLAKSLELGDGWIGGFLPTGGHPWKHISAAGALLCYCLWGIRRRPLYGSIDNTCRPSVL